MATNASKITNISSGIYFKETDLTVITQSVGTFAGAMIGLTEKGPAFQVISSSTFGERAVRLGNLNPLYASSYYAREFLEQANNYKEVRILGLEGYNETEGGSDKAFVVLYDVGSAAPRLPYGGTAPFDTPVTAAMQSIAAVLKLRKTDWTSFAEVQWVEVTTTTPRDGGSPAATDDLFSIIIHYTDPANDITVPCSLRPEAKEYIGKVFGTSPRDNTKVQNRTSPLWVEFVYDSLTSKPTIALDSDYYYPGTLTAGTSSKLTLVTGDMTIQTGFAYPITSVTGSITVGSTTTVAATLPASIVNGTPIVLNNVTGVVLTNVVDSNNAPVTDPNGVTLYAGNVNAGVSCDLYTDDTLTTLVTTTGPDTSTVATIQQVFIATWEKEVMTLGGTTDELAIPFQTPITPWFVSDADNHGFVQRLFRAWSISDGESANVEIKLEIANINPDGNLGYGSFDIYVRQFGDREDTTRSVVEAFTNLTLNPSSDNYIKRRIGDGEDFPLRSKYIFIEMNDTEELPSDSLPYGIEGYVNTTGLVMPDVVWTNDYDFSKPLSKQALGLPNNKTNMFAKLVGEYLSYKNVTNLAPATGIGFHLNPNGNTLIDSSLFVTPPAPIGPATVSKIYQVNPPTNTNPVSGLEKVKRSRYVVAFAGGFDGFNVYKSRDWGTSTSKDFAALSIAIDILGDKESLEADFSVLVTPDMNFEDHAVATEKVLEMVTGRGDALYIPDFRYSVDCIVEDAKTSLLASNMNTNFTAVYYPHCQIEDLTNKVNLWLPPSMIALATIAATATNEQVWQPPAGSLRTITSNLVRTRRRMRIEDRDVLKSANINPITLFPGSGFEITESRTTQEVFSALSFVHNRLLLGYAKKALNQTLRPILHQLNTVNLRNAFVNTITPVFERIKKLNGLEEFKVSVIDNQEDRTTLYGVIEIVPLYPVERIIIDFQLKNGSLDFNQ